MPEDIFSSEIQEGTLLDLGNYQAVKLSPRGTSRAGSQLLLTCLETGNDVATIYTQPAFAMAEVIYSKLCKVVGLNCVQARYGHNQQSPFKSPFISVSEFSHDWIPWELWRSEWLDQALENNQEVDEHAVLTYLNQHLWDDAYAGYVIDKARYAKAHNGHSLYSLGLSMLIDDAPSTAARHSVFHAKKFLEDTAAHSSGRKILLPVAELTDDQIDHCVEIPHWEKEKLARKFFIRQLKRLRGVAEQVVEKM